MDLRLSMTSDFSAAARQLRERAPIAIARALNRTGATARTAMVREVSRDLGLQQKAIRDQFLSSDARPDKLVFRLSTTGKRIPLYDFKARGPMPSRGRGRGVTAKLPGGAGSYPNAFIARMRSGHLGVFQRRGKARLPIYELMGPSLPKVFAKYLPLGQARANEVMPKNLAHELAFELRQIGKAS